LPKSLDMCAPEPSGKAGEAYFGNRE